MGLKIEIPRESADQFKESTKNAALRAAVDLLRQVDDGELSREEAVDVLETAIGSAIDAVATLADVVVVLPEPTESLVDLAIQQGADILKGLASEPLARLVDALDEALGYNPRRAARRLANLIDRDLQDGIVGNDRAARIKRLAARIAYKSPALAAELEIDGPNAGGRITIGGHTW